MDTKINNNSGWDLFGPETFADTWTEVTDSNGNSIRVTVDEMFEENPNDGDIYIQVDYCGQSWWISQDFHFPM
jgi:hypothetical protein